MDNLKDFEKRVMRVHVVKERKCLRCEAKFLSESSCNRICAPCNQVNLQIEGSRITGSHFPNYNYSKIK